MNFTERKFQKKLSKTEYKQNQEKLMNSTSSRKDPGQALT